jgi:hypothetical protein
MSIIDQLTISDAAKRDSKSFELLRVWIAENNQHVSLRAGVWEDPAAWGIMLADLAGHVANTYEQSEGRNRAETLQRIKAGFDAEMSSPTDPEAGG